jgi:hypothetical protein
MKYIMMRRDLAGVAQEFPIIFPDFLVHRHVASAIKNFGGNVYEIDNRVVAAGDIHFDDIVCSGHSETLKSKSREEDSKIIKMFDYFQGLK